MRRLFLLCLSVFFVTLSYAQMEPVSWSYDYEKVGEQEYEIIFSANIQDGWCIYSVYMEEGGPIPTSIVFENEADFQLVGKAKEIGLKEEKFDESFNMNLKKLKGRSKIKQRIKLVNTDAGSIVGQITYMSCNESGCLPPKNVDFEIDLEE